jgi:hypothetical protein
MHTAAPENYINIRCFGVYTTSHLLSDLPDPRRMASRPVDCIAATIAEGAAVPSIETNWSLRFAETLLIPESY